MKGDELWSGNSSPFIAFTDEFLNEISEQMQIKLIRQAIANKTLRTIPTGFEKLVPLNGRNCILASAI
jgi:hypothetical protein